MKALSMMGHAFTCRAIVIMPLVSVPLRHGRSPVRIKRPSEKRCVSRSATRALDVLELFGEAQRGLRAVEIIGRLGISSSTANQLLKTMVDSGHLIFEARTKIYLPSPRLLAFGRWIIDGYGGHAGLHGLVTKLSERSGLGVAISSPNDLFMQIIDLAAMPWDTHVRGLQISMFGSTIGSAYLATLPDNEVVRLCRRARMPSDQEAQVIKDVAAIRRDAFADGPSLNGETWSIAMSVTGQHRNYPLILSLNGPTAIVRTRMEWLKKAMLCAVGEWVANSGPDNEQNHNSAKRQ